MKVFHWTMQIKHGGWSDIVMSMGYGGTVMHMPDIKSKKDVVHYVNEVGYLPFFRNHISGFSLEDMLEPIYWYDGFSDKEIKWPAWS